MNLAVVLILAMVFLLAFSIGVNLGLHGVLSVGEKRIVPDENAERVINSDSSRSEAKTTELSIQTAANAKIETNSELDVSSKLKASVDQTVPKVGNSAPAPFKARTTTTIKIDTSSQATPKTRPPIAFEKQKDGQPKPVRSISIGDALKDVYNGAKVVNSLKAVHTSQVTESDQSSPISDYLRSGGKVPIVLLTCNRPDQLKVTLESLFAVRGVEKANILIAQDGAMEDIARLAKLNGLTLIQNTEGLNLRGGNIDGAARIAMHYKFSLSSAFNKFSSSPAVIIVEDDLLFSPDFYEYLTSTAPILEHDPTTFVVSAWNDNGFKERVVDPYGLRRTEFFPGLGWLLPRKLYKNELEKKWPKEHWDHWLRSFEIHGTREIVYPEVPRTYHNGIKGTFMNMETHNKYFRDIAYNTDSAIIWPDPSRKDAPLLKWDEWSLDRPKGKGPVGGEEHYLTASKEVYDARIEEMVSKCHHVKSFQDMVSQSGLLCVWINVNPDPMWGRPPEFEAISSFFGIWHEHKRGAHRGLHEFFWEDNYILIFNIFGMNTQDSYKHLRPVSAPIIEPKTFDKKLALEPKRRRMGLEGTPATAAGLSCDQVCSAKGLSCREDLLPLLNTCPALYEKFPCRDCIDSYGPEQPAYVSPDAGAGHSPGKCLVSSNPERSTCAATHAVTLRLCACA